MTTPVYAGEPEADSVRVPGTAEVVVSPDQLEINFGLITVSDSFRDAAEAAKEMATKLQGISTPDDALRVSVDYDLTFMQQKKWGKGSNLKHRFRMTIDKVPDGAAQDTLVAIVDSALSLDSKLTVIGFRAQLSEDRASHVRAKLLQMAVRDATTNASVIAEAVQLRLGSPIRIDVGPGEDPLTGRFYARYSEFDGYGLGRRKPFVVDSDLVSEIRVSLGVVVDFAVEPR